MTSITLGQGLAALMRCRVSTVLSYSVGAASASLRKFSRLHPLQVSPLSGH